MPSCTDPLRLNENELFKVLKAGLPGDQKNTKNILEIRDDILYLWNPDKCCIFTLNVGAVGGQSGETVSHQILQPVDPPIFEITNLLINETATQVALWGNLGIVLIDLPRRWGKDNAFQGGKEVITCMNYNLNGHSSKLTSTEIRKVRWHPGSSSDSHLLVLTSENTFQLYDCEMGTSPKLLKTQKLGPIPLPSPSKTLPGIEALGDTAVDFDFLSPSAKGQSNDPAHIWNKIEWPIVILRGNGEVIIVNENILSSSPGKKDSLQPLTMYPATTDNYGTDFCSIMCIPTTPPIVAIASCSGKIYHTIFLRDPETSDHQNGSLNSQNDSSVVPQKSDDTLFVFEIAEIELGLLWNESDKKYTCPIQLHYDKINRSRYFCSHNAGIHMITVPAVSQLDKYVNSEDNNSELSLQTALNPSNSQYLVCTRTKHTKSNEVAPILGFGFREQPCPVLIALLHTGDVVDMSIVDLNYLPKTEMPERVSNNHNKEISRESFYDHIWDLLKKDSTSQPITKLDAKSQLSGKEYLELLLGTTETFRTIHCEKFHRVRKDIARKVESLKKLKEHQLRELETLTEMKKELRAKAEYLADYYEDIKDKQEQLAKRSEEVLRLVNYKELSSVENKERIQLKELDNKIQNFVVRLCQLKKKAANQAAHIESKKRSERKSELILNSKQEEAIKSNIGQMAKDIKSMMIQVKTLEEEVAI